MRNGGSAAGLLTVHQALLQRLVNDPAAFVFSSPLFHDDSVLVSNQLEARHDVGVPERAGHDQGQASVSGADCDRPTNAAEAAESILIAGVSSKHWNWKNSAVDEEMAARLEANEQTAAGSEDERPLALPESVEMRALLALEPDVN